MKQLTRPISIVPEVVIETRNGALGGLHNKTIANYTESNSIIANNSTLRFLTDQTEVYFTY